MQSISSVLSQLRFLAVLHVLTQITKNHHYNNNPNNNPERNKYRKTETTALKG